MIVARAQLAICLGPLCEINSHDRGGAGGGSIDGAPRPPALFLFEGTMEAVADRLRDVIKEAALAEHNMCLNRHSGGQQDVR